MKRYCRPDITFLDFEQDVILSSNGLIEAPFGGSDGEEMF